MPGWAAGSYNGPVGEAYFLEDLYHVTRKQEYITADGGFIVFLDIVYRRTGIRKYLDFASEAAEPGMTVGGEPSPPE